MTSRAGSGDRPVHNLSRRQFILSVGGTAGAAALLTLPGCGYFSAESCGEAYAPWRFPGGESRPEYLAVAAAILAANPHNTQPWKFGISPDRIELYADLAKSLGPMDGLHREMYLGLGCALENLVIAARHHGRQETVTLLPNPGDETLAAEVQLVEAPAAEQDLYSSLARRHTNRGRYLDDTPPPGLEDAIRARIIEPEVQLTFIVDATGKRSFREGTIDATKAIVEDSEMNEASHRWWRQTCDDIEQHRDGLTLDATGQDSTTRFFGKIFAAPDAKKAGEYWVSMTKGDQASAAAYLILSTPDRYDRSEQLKCGRAFQRIALWAAGEGLAIQPLNQMAERQDREFQLGLAPRFTTILQELVGSTSLGPQMLCRIGYPWDDAFESPRRPIDWVTL